jgi:hypothetical protein
LPPKDLPAGKDFPEDAAQIRSNSNSEVWSMNKRLQAGPGREKGGNNNLDPFGPVNPRLQRKAQARSRVSNGRELLPNVDGRSLVARRYRDIMSAIASDQGGVDRLSEARLQLIRRFAAAACLAEQLEARLAHGEQIDIQDHALLVSTMLRVAQRIGVDRVPRDLEPSLTEYLKQGGPFDARHIPARLSQEQETEPCT